MSIKRLILARGIILSAAMGIALIAVWVHSAGQLQTLKTRTVYTTPEEGTRAMTARYYSGVEKVEIVHAGRAIFDDLWFVQARVRAVGRMDGKGFKGQDYDNPGWFFLRLQSGWAFVPEGQWPEVIALGKWLFGFSG